MGKQDKVIAVLVFILSLIGILMVLSVSSLMEIQHHQLHLTKFLKQIFWVILGMTVMIYTSQFNYRKIQEKAYLFLFVGFALLLLVLIAGSVKNGAQRWFNLGIINFQPTMIAMVFLVVYVSEFLSRKRHELNSLQKGLLPVLVVTLAYVFLLLLQPDYSSAMILLIMVFGILFFSPIPWRYLLSLALIGGIFSVAALMMRSYRLERIRSMFSDVANFKLTQVGHAVIALGSGGLFGEGYAASKMKLFFLQAADTDFIAAILGEEFGFLGMTVIFALFFLLFFRILRIIYRSQESYQFYLATGLFLILFLHFFINIGVVLNLLPPTGVPLPFISYGGSHILTEFFIAGILINLSGNLTPSTVTGRMADRKVVFASKTKTRRRNTGRKIRTY